MLVRKREVWILPGGKPQEGESDLDCLRREVEEEISVEIIGQPQVYKDVIGITPHKRDQLTAKVYLVEIRGEPEPGAEINQVKCIGDPLNYHLSDITRKIIISLQNDGYLI